MRFTVCFLILLVTTPSRVYVSHLETIGEEDILDIDSKQIECKISSIYAHLNKVGCAYIDCLESIEKVKLPLETMMNSLKSYESFISQLEKEFHCKFGNNLHEQKNKNFIYPVKFNRLLASRKQKIKHDMNSLENMYSYFDFFYRKIYFEYINCGDDIIKYLNECNEKIEGNQKIK
ncbi:hypothetical protein EDEG_03895 [Edhazardia aedis USNM 41457]|uniref:Uncharacterized protein n=1 Tax=Edhazardia aedis (strain USNM 41457) TaxID=1003232 RepID=J9D1T4_EDHAE|nr:hypothetical protein EDEG_03895 [Edhazardia aedis USNM 41457]|eukprot:EJW01539.1 hypothetical protein EDEG_03895 [Edhazardia aedis USNM 41457]